MTFILFTKTLNTAKLLLNNPDIHKANLNYSTTSVTELRELSSLQLNYNQSQMYLVLFQSVMLQNKKPKTFSVSMRQNIAIKIT